MYNVIDIIYFLKYKEQYEIEFRYIFICEQYKNRLRVHSKFMIVITPKKKVMKGISTLSAMFYFFYLKIIILVSNKK